MTARLEDAKWLRHGPLVRLLDVLDRDGEEARVVGGAVRNALLGMPIHEFDVATTAEPQTVVARAEQASFKTAPTGIDHGTVTVIVEGRPFEVTSLRQDVETYGRKAKVAFGRDWKADAERRDFTINALSVTRDGTVHDYVGGLADLAARRVRFIGRAADRIAEDYLRILRFFRFHAAYGEGLPDADGLAACIAARAGLAGLSRERIRMELLKLLAAPHAVPVLAVMSETGLLVSLLGGVPLLASLSNMMKAENAIGLAADPVRRLGALGVIVSEDAKRLTQRLRLANAEHDRLESMGDGWWRICAQSSAKDMRALLYRLQTERFIDRILLAWSRSPESLSDAHWQEMAGLPRRWTPPDFPIASAQVMARGVPKGPLLGRVLRSAEQTWIAADFPADQESIDRILDNAIAATK
ncbi:MAG: CCA tRNA nucleotidyltransferase [Pseudorhodoplanes sp.]|jgi:tRNA nucleotidyltransferase/poly(A) polymerase|nr:CCA tRNA nucleotidyltransferase [Pseudorhodoplanes sp.]